MCCGDVAALVHCLISPLHCGSTHHPPHKHLLVRLGAGARNPPCEQWLAGKGRVLVMLVLLWRRQPWVTGVRGDSDVAGMQGSGGCLPCGYPPQEVSQDPSGPS